MGGKLSTEQIYNSNNNYLDTIDPSAALENTFTLLLLEHGRQLVSLIDGPLPS